MSTISTHLRDYREPSKEQATRLFFSLPTTPNEGPNDQPNLAMEINAVLTLESQEDSYVCTSYTDPTIILTSTRPENYTSYRPFSPSLP